jgi:hypothetical protein
MSVQSAIEECGAVLFFLVLLGIEGLIEFDQMGMLDDEMG